MTNRTLHGALKPYVYWVLRVLKDEGGEANIETLYRRVYAQLEPPIKAGKKHAPIVASRRESRWKSEIRSALRNMSSYKSGDGRVAHLHHGRWRITEKGRRWLQDNPTPYKFWDEREEIA